jgi:hypothetical protein
MRKKVYCGGEYREFELLPREKVEEIIADLDLEQVVRCAKEGYVQGFKSGIATLDLVSGKLTSDSLGTNESQHPWEAVYVVLFEIGQNESLDDFQVNGDILNEEEYAEYKEMLKNDEISCYEEYAEKKGIDLKERFIENQVYYTEGKEFLAKVKDQLNKWYRD